MPVIPDKKKSSYEVELIRRSNDLLRVFNPTDEDFVIVWDLRSGGNYFRVPAKGEAVFPRYISEKYIKEMYDKILNDKAKTAIFKENERRISAGMQAMDKTLKTNEQMVFEQKFYNPSSEESKKIISLLYVGLETEYGVDRQFQIEQKQATERDFKNILSDVQSEKGTVTTDSEKTQENTSSEATEEIYRCDHPGCNFVAKSKLGLFSHKKSHRQEAEQLLA
jgi:hypothetical protein